MNPGYIPLILIGVISLVSVVFTIYDKIAAKKNPRHRVPEKTLFLLSALGGSVAMYITMQLIRHKTKHLSFMVGIPAIIVLQFFLVIGFLWLREQGYLPF